MGGKEEQIRPPGEESIPETPFGKAMREAVERRKREEDPSYEGGNPKDAVDVQKDLESLGVIQKSYSPEEEKKLSRSRQGVIGAASKAKQAEKVGEQWYFSEELRKKAYQEMMDELAKRSIKLDEKFRRFNWPEKKESKATKRVGKVAEQKKKEAGIIEKEQTLSPKEEAEYNYFNILLKTMPDTKAGKPIEDDKLARKVVDLRKEAERLGGDIDQIRAEAEKILIEKGLIKGKERLTPAASTLLAKEIAPGWSPKKASVRKETAFMLPTVEEASKKTVKKEKKQLEPLLPEELIEAGQELNLLALRKREGGLTNEEQILRLERNLGIARQKLLKVGFGETVLKTLEEAGPKKKREEIVKILLAVPLREKREEREEMKTPASEEVGAPEEVVEEDLYRREGPTPGEEETEGILDISPEERAREEELKGIIPFLEEKWLKEFTRPEYEALGLSRETLELIQKDMARKNLNELRGLD